MVPKICDFGWATKIGKSEKRGTFCGTFEYMAPEIYESEKYDENVDIWSLGILLYELFHGISPFGKKNAFKIYKNIVNDTLSFKEGIDENAKHLILILLDKDPQKRPKIRQILEHPFFTNLKL